MVNLSLHHMGEGWVCNTRPMIYNLKENLIVSLYTSD
jgi:hypothetical protein